MEKELVASVQRAGVVGAGGAGFPTYKKLDARADLVVVNGAECEPLLRVDQQLMEREATSLVDALERVMEETSAGQGILAIKAKHGKAALALEAALKGRSGVRLKLLDDFYPAGDEQVLTYEATGRVVPEGGIPLQVGVIVINTETLLNVGNAINGKPFTDKYVTVSGAVKNPVTVKVPIGMAIQDLIEVGGPIPGHYRVIEGGPMMGSILTSTAEPVTKTTKGLIVLPDGHPLLLMKQINWAHVLKRAKSVCCQCNRCTAVCPRYHLGHRMEPHRVMRSLGQGGDIAAGDATRAFLCCQCGACEAFGCEMGLAPNRVNAQLKKQLVAAGVKNPYNNPQPEPTSGRDIHKIPVKRLISRLGLVAYDHPAPLRLDDYSPDRVVLRLKQHIGAPAKPVVRVGDTVSRGDMVAEAMAGALSVPVHASISGRVVTVTVEEIVIERQGGPAA